MSAEDNTPPPSFSSEFVSHPLVECTGTNADGKVNLLIIDSSVYDVSGIVSSLTDYTDYWVFDFHHNTLSDIQSIVTKPYHSVGLAQHNKQLNWYRMTEEMDLATISNVEQEDASLATWSPIKSLLAHFETLGVENFDFLACDLWADPDWQYIITELDAASALHIRASVNITGAGGDWVLESDGTDTIGIYFTPSILDYKYALYYAVTSAAAPHNAYNPPVPLPTPGGTITLTKYTTLLGSMTSAGTGFAGSTYLAPTSNMLNVTNFVSSGVAHAVLSNTGKLTMFGTDVLGGNVSTVANDISSGIVKVVPSYQAYAALRNDGIIFTWGSLGYPLVPVTTTGNASIISSTSVDLTGCIDVVAAGNGNGQGNCFAGLKANGTVVQWGMCQTWTGQPTAADLSGVVQLKESLSIPYSYVALRSDGHAIMWGSGGTVRTTGLTLTSPIVSIHPYDYGTVIVRQSGTIHIGFTDTITYTIPAGRTLVRIVPLPNSAHIAIMMDDLSMYFTLTSTLITGVSDIVVNDQTNTYAYIKNGAVIAGGDARFGGSTTDATNGIKSGISVSSGVIRLASAYASIAALKSDGTVAAWGANSGGWNQISAVQSLLTNVVQLVGLYGGYIAVTSDRRIISWGDGANAWKNTNTTPTVTNTTFSAGNTVSIMPSVYSAVIVDMSAITSVTVNSVVGGSLTQYVGGTVVYTTNVQANVAIAGRRYGLYSGATLLGSFIPTVDTYTYTFTNVTSATSGVLLCTIKDYTDVVFTIDSYTATSGLYIYASPNASMPVSNPPTISTIYAGPSSITAWLGAPTLVGGGLPTLGYKYSIDGGATFQSVSQTVASGVTFGAKSTAISTGTSTNMIRTVVNTDGTKMYVSDVNTAKILYSSYNGTSWSALASVSPTFALPGATGDCYGFDMNGDCTRGVSVSGAGALGCYYFTNAFSAPVLIVDPSSRAYSCVAISQDGNTVVALVSNAVFYTTWNDASQNYRPFTRANADVLSSETSVAVNSDGKMIAYTSSNATKVSYTRWNGTNYNPGTLITPPSQAIYGLRFSLDGNVLFATCQTTTVYASYWNGTDFSAFTLLTTLVASDSTSLPYGIGVDQSNNMYVSMYRNTSIFKVTTTTTTTTTATPSMVKLTSGLTNGTSYTMQFKATNAGGDSTAVVASSAVTPYALPGAPSITSAVGGNGSIALTFTAGAANGSEITSYYYSIDASGLIYTGTGSSATSYTITGLTNGNTYTVRLKSANAAGLSTAFATSSPISLYGVPGASIINSCVAGTGQITINFTDSSANGGSPITGHYYSTASGGTYTYTSQVASPIIVTGLAGGTTYYVRLMSVNVAGNSAPTAATTVTLANSVPSQPVISTLTPASQSLTIGFTAPSNGGLAITNYFYSIDNGTTYTSTGNTNTSISISGLTNGTNYSVMIRAANSLGNSAPSAAVVGTPRTLPGAPTISSVAFGNQSIVVSYTAPASNGGSAITGYQYSINGGSSYVFCGSGNPFTISGLTNGQSYTVLLQSINVAGNSAASAASSAVVPCTVPNSPAISTVVAGNQSLTVSYTAPAVNGGSVVTGYLYSYDQTNYTSLNTTTNPFTITGLTNGQSYRVSMIAQNVAGNSSVSSLSTATTPLTTPNAPVISSSVLGNGQVAVSYSLPYDGGNTIDDIQYKVNGGSYVSVGAVTNFTITGLSNGSTYSIQIRAHNTAGYSADSSAISAIPRKVADAPVVQFATAGDSSMLVKFSASAYNGGNTITGYAYTLNNGAYVSCTPSTAFTIGSLTNGTTYLLQVYAQNAAGYSTASNSFSVVPLPAPSAPTLASASVVGTSVALSFTDNTNAGPPILGYKTVVTNTSTGVTTTSYARETSSPVYVTGLSSGVDYSLGLIAYSAVGDSASSSTLSASLYGVPNAPTITSVVAGNQTAQVYLTDGSANGSAIQGYKYSLDGVTFTTSASTSSPISVTGLTNGTSYVLCVRAFNAAGDSVNSNLSSSFTPYTVPAAPTILSVTPGNQQVTLSVRNLPINGATVTGYYWSTDGASWTSVTSAGYSYPTTLTLSGLTNGTSYQIQLKSVSNAGNSSVATSSAFVPANVPGELTVNNVRPGDQKLIIDFSNGATNGAAIQYYMYSFDGSTYRYASQIESPITLYPLPNAVSYPITLKAGNSAGLSPASNTYPGTIPYGNPFAPVISKILPGNECVYVYYNPIDNNGSPVTKLSYSLGGTMFDFSGNFDSPVTISGLKNKVPVSVVLFATNTSGISPASAPVSIIPGVPTAPTITNITTADSKIFVEFTPPDSFNGSPLTKYSWGVVGQNLTSFTALSGNTSPLAITVVNGLSYNIALIAANANGVSIASNSLGAVSPYSNPLKLATPPTVIPLLNTMRVSFVAANKNGSNITKYEYKYIVGTTAGEWTDCSGLYTNSTWNPLLGLTGVPTPDASGLIRFVAPADNNVSYTVMIRSYNIAGVSPESAPSKGVKWVYIPPVAPKAPTVTTSFRTLNVVVSPPVNNGYAIIKYKYKLNTQDTYTDASGTTGTFSIPDVSNNFMYTVQVIATNQAGDSIASLASKPVQFVYVPPNQPKVTTLTASYQTLKVVFTAPAPNPAMAAYPVTTYKYSLVTPDGSSAFVNMNTTDLSYVITNVDNNVNYNIQIVATNAAGDSVPSALLTKTALYTYLPPAAGPVLGNVVADNQSATFSFTAPAIRNAPITSYAYTFNGGNTYIDLSSTSLTATITGLTNDASYTMSVVANTPAGYSPLSAPKSFAPYYRPPPLGPIIKSATTSNQTAVVTYTAPVPSNAPITTYKYSVNGGSTIVDISSTANPITITGLTNNTPLSLLLYAGTPAGNSPASAPFAVNIVYSAPAAPVVAPTGLVPWNEGANITITQPAANGSPITGYKYSVDACGNTLVDASSVITGNTAVIEVRGLTNDVSYNFLSIYAVNSVGVSPRSAPVAVKPINKVPNAPVIIPAGFIPWNEGANLTIAQPAANGSPITGYKYSVDACGNTLFDASSVITGTTASIAVRGLTNDVSYNFFSIYAVNSVGVSPKSAPVLLKPIFKAPGVPTVSKVVPASTSAVVTYSAPVTVNGAAITYYTYSTNGTTFTDLSGIPSSPFLISGLTPNTSYSMRMQAVNAAGTSLPSTAVAFITKP